MQNLTDVVIGQPFPLFRSRSSVDPLMRSIRDGVDAILLTMHNENFESGNVGGGKKSPYLKELETFISRVSIEFLSYFECKLLLAECVQVQTNLLKGSYYYSS